MSSTPSRRAALLVLALLALAWPDAAHAQQQVELPGVGYDPCLDPTKVEIWAFDSSDDAHGASASGNHEFVAISGSQTIWFCGGSVQGSAAGTITLRFGTGSACATSPTVIGTVRVTTEGEGKVFIAPGSYLKSDAGQAFCGIRSATMVLYGELRFVQENAP